MRLYANLFRSFFDASISSIVLHLDDLLHKPENADVEAILMVGCYSESPLLQQTIRKKFNDLKVVIPNEAGLAVLKGAVIYGHDSTVIRERVAKYTYGTDIEGEEISPGLFTDHRFDTLIANGQTLVVGEPQQEKTYQPVKIDQKALDFDIYVTRDKKPYIRY
ncbi:hypothetical protein DPMN_072091 [Dreissena polymorpha]|uniref:Uncharacterized protein n=1 Tax=Dreissena polymorpha TaxID=45954 RepID=A0A9D3Z7Y1_DREPO|nr:hypothetical protein DPMN_072091 [Dreissena polymorpha]